mmetsp:Transcript_37803/g.57871  ORF Transcript_37803/g.57871 Transcript_37803/m.57871 type:complete len:149 (-) Transcript_37803:38-484(-)
MQRIEQIYEEQPHMLPMMGIDLKKAEDELAKFQAIKDRVKNPYDPKVKQQEIEAESRQKWAAWLEVYQAVLASAVPEGCSAEEFEGDRTASMNRVNPAFILRNYLMEEAITKAEDNDDFSGVRDLLEKCLHPFKGGEAAITQHPSWRF